MILSMELITVSVKERAYRYIADVDLEPVKWDFITLILIKLTILKIILYIIWT